MPNVSRKLMRFQALGVFILLVAATPGLAEVTFMPRHVLILRPQVDQVMGSYMFAFENHGSAAEEFSGEIMLPRETFDFQVQEGLDQSQVVPGPSGGLVARKSVEPGTNLVLVGFLVKARFGRATLTLQPSMAIEDLSILVPPGSVSMEAPGGTIQPGVDFSGHTFDRLAIPSLGAGQKVVVELRGVPEGRFGLWVVGSGVGVILLAAAIFFAWKTRPAIPTGSSSVNL